MAFLEADDEARTRDPQLGKLMLYRLSYARGSLGFYPCPIDGLAQATVIPEAR